uniref:Uncharacterized protein n=1 Tax=Anopheles farauti TaxID=69004 RepID=A0A182QZ22_9DIPT
MFDKRPPEVEEAVEKENGETECSCGTGGLYSPGAGGKGGDKGCRKCPTRPVGTGVTQKKHNSSKFKDASTSPKSSSPMKVPPAPPAPCRSPKLEASTDTKFDFNFSPKTEHHYRRLSSLSINSSTGKQPPSPRKHDNATTVMSPKLSPHKLTPTRAATGHERSTLEKSNSLGDSKPTRLLRNTRSLSPRPPVRHQHSIMVSDENDIISVKLSPNEEFDEGGLKKREGAVMAAVETSEEDGKKLTECLKGTNANNRSTSCLVYVPSDPWTRMPPAAATTNTAAAVAAAAAAAAAAAPNSSPLLSSIKRQKSKTLDNNSSGRRAYYGKPTLGEGVKNADPWVWRSNVNLPDDLRRGDGGKKRGVLSHQTKSLTMGANVARDEPVRLCHQQSLGRFEKTLTIPGVVDDARKKITRPKPQRSKSPSFYEDFFGQPSSESNGGGAKAVGGSLSLSGKNKSVSSLKLEKNASNSTLNGHGGGTGNGNHHTSSATSASGSFSSYNGNGSPTARKQPSPKLTILPAGGAAASSPAKQTDPSKGGSLSVLNPNLLQPRHSFSTPSQKDDELQLNIRRLSEQMSKYSHSTGFPTAPPAFLNDTILHQQHYKHQQPAPLASGGVGAAKKVGGGSGGSLTVVGTGGGSTGGGLNEAATQRKAASHSKINEPILETRC